MAPVDPYPSTGRYAIPAAFLAWGWLYAYVLLASRVPKIRLGLDHQSNPRLDLVKHGEAAVRDGKLTRTQLGRIQRLESASANSTEAYPFFGMSVILATIADVPMSSITTACSIYSVLRVAYGLAYVYIEDDRKSRIRALLWWSSNFCCLYMLWKAGTV